MTVGPFPTTDQNVFLGQRANDRAKGEVLVFPTIANTKGPSEYKVGVPCCNVNAAKNKPVKEDGLHRTGYKRTGENQRIAEDNGLALGINISLPGLQINGKRSPRGLCLPTRPTPNLSSGSSVAF